MIGKTVHGPSHFGPTILLHAKFDKDFASKLAKAIIALRRFYKLLLKTKYLRKYYVYSAVALNTLQHGTESWFTGLRILRLTI